MRQTASMTLITALAARTPMWSADLFTIMLPDNTTYRWTSADQPVTYSGNIWRSDGPIIERSAWSARNTTEIPELSIQIYSSGTDFGSVNLLDAAHKGLFDGAYLTLERAFMPQFGDTSLGTVLLFGGRFGALEINALGIKATITASNVLMSQNLPRRSFQSSCMHTLYDESCGLSAADYTDHYTVSACNGIGLYWVGSILVDDPVKYLQGVATITSGAGAGQRLTVNYSSDIGVAFGYPLLTVPAAGDTFTVEQGCLKTVARCQQFNNTLNYGGFPYIPPVSQGI